VSISQVRTTFNALIASYDSAIEEWKESFDLENIPRMKLNKSYIFEYGPISGQSMSDLVLDDNLSVVLKVYVKSDKNNKNEMDTIFDYCHRLRLKLIEPSASMVGINIKNIVCTSITPRVIETNSRVIEMTMNFNVRLIFKGASQ
jgi:hypothetical protein